MAALAPDIESLLSGLLPWISVPAASTPPKQPQTNVVTTAPTTSRLVVPTSPLPPESPVLSEFWQEWANVFNFLQLTAGSFAADIKKSPEFPVSSVGDHTIPVGFYSLTKDGLRRWHNKKWIVQLEVNAAHLGEVTSFSPAKPYFRLV